MINRTNTLRGFMLDTNVFNHLIEGRIAMSSLPSEFSIFVTHIQKDEIDNNWEPKTEDDAEKKAQVLEQFKMLPDAMLPTESTILGVSVLGESKLGKGENYKKIFEFLMAIDPKRIDANQADALIGEVALNVGLELITGDRNLKHIVEQLGGVARDISSPKKS